MQEVKYAVEIQDGWWVVHSVSGSGHLARVMPAKEFARFLLGEAYQADFTVMEWDDGEAADTEEAPHVLSLGPLHNS